MIYAKRKVAYKKENLEHNCVLQRSILLVKGGITFHILSKITKTQ